MRKKIISIQLFLLLLANLGFAQSEIEKQFKSLQLNSSPAYVVLGVEPENIQRPNSPTDFIASVQSAIVNERLQPNFAMETSPYYWGRKKPDSKRFNVVDYLTNKNYWQNLAKSTTLSFATSPSDSLTFTKIQNGVGFGIGIHLQLVQGNISKNVRNNLLVWFDATRTQILLEGIIAKLESNSNIMNLSEWLETTLKLSAYAALDDKKKAGLKSVIENKLGVNALTPKSLPLVRKLRNELKDQSVKSLGKVNESYQFPLTREGFMLEFAIANASVTRNSKWDSLQSAKTSIWLTPSYRFNINKNPEIIDFIDLMVVARLTFNAKDVDSSNYFDIGGKLQWIHNKLSISGEGIFRYLTNKPQNQIKNYTLRTDLTFSYKLNELVTFKATFGSNFDGNSTRYSDPSKMFMVGGFNFGFSNFLKGDKNKTE